MRLHKLFRFYRPAWSFAIPVIALSAYTLWPIDPMTAVCISLIAVGPVAFALGMWIYGINIELQHRDI